MEYPKKTCCNDGVYKSQKYTNMQKCTTRGSGRSLWASHFFCETKQTIQKLMNEGSKMNGKTQKNNKEKNTLTMDHFFDV